MDTQKKNLEVILSSIDLLFKSLPDTKFEYIVEKVGKSEKISSWITEVFVI